MANKRVSVAIRPDNCGDLGTGHYMRMSIQHDEHIKGTHMAENTFSQSLRRGLGGAVVELRNAKDKSVYRDIVLRCCLRDISHDWQVEGTKGFYLYQALCALDEKDEYEKIIIGKYLSRCDDVLFRQLTEILYYSAQDGSLPAKDALRKKYDYFLAKNAQLIKNRIDEGFQWEKVATSLFTIDGFSAFKRYAMDMGTLLQKYPNKRNVLYYDWFITNAEDAFGKKRTAAYIDKMYAKSDAIKSLVDTMKGDELKCKQYQENCKDEQVTVESILQAAQEMASGEIEHYGPVMRLNRLFLKNAAEADILGLANIALSETNEAVKDSLLRIFLSNMFWRKPFPLGADPLLEYAQSSNENLHETALWLLEEFKDKRIHSLAVQLIKAKGIKSSALGLLKKNYRKSDDYIIAEAVKKASRIPQDVQSDISDIYSRYRSVNALPTLLHVYEKGECSHCRYHIVKAMRHCRVLPEKILSDCLYDSYDDTRKYAKRLTAKQKRMKEAS